VGHPSPTRLTACPGQLRMSIEDTLTQGRDVKDVLAVDRRGTSPSCRCKEWHWGRMGRSMVGDRGRSSTGTGDVPGSVRSVLPMRWIRSAIRCCPAAAFTLQKRGSGAPGRLGVVQRNELGLVVERDDRPGVTTFEAITQLGPLGAEQRPAVETAAVAGQRRLDADVGEAAQAPGRQRARRAGWRRP
jgi:hypothetical protein